MTDSSSLFETELNQLTPSAVPRQLLDRLTDCTELNGSQLSVAELEFEQTLLNSPPKTLSPELFSRLEATLNKIPFPDTQNIVTFPKKAHVSFKRFSIKPWAAAAVAVVGAFCAWQIPTHSGSGPVVSNEAKLPAAISQVAPQPNTVNRSTPLKPDFATLTGSDRNARNPSRSSLGALTPASFTSQLSEASDQGVISSLNHKPHRLLKVVYKDQVILKDNLGATYQMAQPRREYILVPINPK